MSESRQRRPGELVFTLLLLAGSLFMLWEAYGISRFESITSAGVYPMLAALTMVATAALIVWSTVHTPPASGEPGQTLVQQFVHQLSPAVLVAFTAAIALYMLALQPLGFVISSYVFLVAGMRLLGSRRWGLNLLVSAACLAVIYLVFQTAFSVVLPKGTWVQGWLK
jgi:putative tricarboxylic transport membrane protein